MNDWKSSKLGIVADTINGGAWSDGEYVDSGIPVVRVSDFRDNSIDLSNCRYLPESSLSRYAKHQLHQGDLVIATVGSHPTHPASVVGRPVGRAAMRRGCLAEPEYGMP